MKKTHSNKTSFSVPIFKWTMCYVNRTSIHNNNFNDDNDSTEKKENQKNSQTKSILHTKFHMNPNRNINFIESITCDVVENCFPACLTADTVNLGNIFKIKNSFLFMLSKTSKCCVRVKAIE